MKELTEQEIKQGKERLKRLLEDELLEIDGQKDKLKQIYASLPETLRRTSELTGIDIQTLITSCKHASWHYDKLEWYQILDIIKAVWLAKRNLEEDESKIGGDNV